jgi:hypothetical protein
MIDSKGYGAASSREGIHDRRCLGNETWRPRAVDLDTLATASLIRARLRMSVMRCRGRLWFW